MDNGKNGKFNNLRYEKLIKAQFLLSVDAREIQFQISLNREKSDCDCSGGLKVGVHQSYLEL